MPRTEIAFDLTLGGRPMKMIRLPPAFHPYGPNMAPCLSPACRYCAMSDDLADKPPAAMTEDELRWLVTMQRKRIFDLGQQLNDALAEATKYQGMYERTYRQLEIAAGG